MNFLQPRLAAITDSPANLIAQLCELSELARAGQQSAAIYSANAARNRRKRKRGGSGFSRSIGGSTVPSRVFTQAAARRGLAGHAALYYFCSVGDPKPPLWGRACRPFLSPKYRSTHCKYEYILAQTVL